MNRTLLLIGVLILMCLPAFAQENTHLILFADKENTPHSLSAPETFLSERSIQRREKQDISITENDLPVSPDYVNALEEVGASVRYTTRWMNGALVDCSQEVLNQILALPFVLNNQVLAFENDTKRLHSPYSPSANSNLAEAEATEQFGFNLFPKSHSILRTQNNYGSSFTQNVMVGVDEMHRLGFAGEGMLVALMDAGFKNVNALSAFDDLNIRETYDFVFDEEDVYRDHDHGTKVLSVMAAFKSGELIGPAYAAEYVLYKTEDRRLEAPVEEVYWLIAAERADSIGVDVINTSLGYNTFDNPEYNYTTDQLDGNTAIITRAADLAASKGMVVVTSAGNTGTSAWRKMTFPADADSVFSIGAVTGSMEPAAFSGEGYTADGRIKPDVSAMGAGASLWTSSDWLASGNGTSYSSPLVAGLVTGFWQAFPELNAMEVMDYIRRSGDRYGRPTVKLGHGIPSFTKAQWLLVEGIDDEKEESTIARIFPNPTTDGGHFTLLPERDFSGKALDIVVTDVSGKKVFQEQIIPNDAHKLTLKDISSGVYLLHLSNNSHYQVIRLLIR